MKRARVVERLFPGIPTVEGAGVHLNRYFGSHESNHFDPFLLLDDFSSNAKSSYQKGFPWHPHRGIETVTYVLDGAVDHGDSLGNSATVSSAEVQWMTAGSGIIHQEMPAGNNEGQLRGFQLWVNLPASSKMTQPLYQSFSEKEIPQIHQSDKSIYRIIAGTFDNVKGPIENRFIDPVFFDLSLSPNTEFVYPTPVDYTFFAYLFEGEASFGAFEGNNITTTPSAFGATSPLQVLPLIGSSQVVLFTSGNFITVSTMKSAARFLLIGGRPLKEPVAWYGPIVMNTAAELQKAFEEFQLGTFIKH